MKFEAQVNNVFEEATKKDGTICFPYSWKCDKLWGRSASSKPHKIGDIVLLDERRFKEKFYFVEIENAHLETEV